MFGASMIGASMIGASMIRSWIISGTGASFATRMTSDDLLTGFTVEEVKSVTIRGALICGVVNF